MYQHSSKSYCLQFEYQYTKFLQKLKKYKQFANTDCVYFKCIFKFGVLQLIILTAIKENVPAYSSQFY